MCVWLQIKRPVYFTIQFIFSTIYETTVLFSIIHGSHCTISTNFYLYLQYFQQKVFSFKFQQNKWIPNYLASLFFANLFYYSAYFCYYLLVILHFLVLFMGSTILFQLTFIFIKKISTNIYFYLQYFQQKVFSFNKIN